MYKTAVGANFHPRHSSRVDLTVHPCPDPCFEMVRTFVSNIGLDPEIPIGGDIQMIEPPDHCRRRGILPVPGNGGDEHLLRLVAGCNLYSVEHAHIVGVEGIDESHELLVPSREEAFALGPLPIHCQRA